MKNGTETTNIESRGNGRMALTEEERKERQRKRNREYARKKRAEKKASDAAKMTGDPSIRAALTNEHHGFSRILASYMQYKLGQPYHVVIIEKLGKPDRFAQLEGRYRLKDVRYHYFDSGADAIEYAKQNGCSRLNLFPE